MSASLAPALALRSKLIYFSSVSLACLAFLFSAVAASAQRIEVTVPARAPLNGHLILVIGKKADPEPRMEVQENYLSAQAFSVDAENFDPAKPLVIDAKTIGYPRHSLADLDPGDYFVQAVFNVYEQFHLASGKTLWLPPDKGEGQHWNLKPGNPYSAPIKFHIDPASHSTLKLTLDTVIPPIEGTDRIPLSWPPKIPPRSGSSSFAFAVRS